MTSFRYVLGAAALLAACGGEPEHLLLDKLPASTRAPAPSSLLRFPEEGGVASLYRVPSLDPSSWKAEDQLPPVQRIVGADAEQGLVFSLDRKHNLITLDLETRRVRTYLEGVRSATMGPDGALYAVDTGSTVTQMVRRAPVRFRSKLQGSPQELYATMTGALLARVGEKAPVLEVLGSDQPPVSTTLPSEAFAPTFYGDLIAVATDTAVIMYQTQGKNAHQVHPAAGPPGGGTLLAVRASAVCRAGRTTNWSCSTGTAAIDSRRSISPARRRGFGMTASGSGSWCGPASGDSVWVIDVGRWRFAGAVATKWATDLPAVASPNTLVIRRGRDVVGIDLGSADFPRPVASREAPRTNGCRSRGGLLVMRRPRSPRTRRPSPAPTAARPRRRCTSR